MEMLSKANTHLTCDRPKDFYLLKGRIRCFKLKKIYKLSKKVIFFLNNHLNHKQSEIKLGKGKLQPDIGKYLTTSYIFLLGEAFHEEVSSGGVKSPPASEPRAALPNPALAAS